MGLYNRLTTQLCNSCFLSRQLWRHRSSSVEPTEWIERDNKQEIVLQWGFTFVMRPVKCLSKAKIGTQVQRNHKILKPDSVTRPAPFSNLVSAPRSWVASAVFDELGEHVDTAIFSSYVSPPYWSFQTQKGCHWHQEHMTSSRQLVPTWDQVEIF